MINTIQVLLQNEEYILKKNDRKIVLFKGKLNIYPEDCIEIEGVILTGKFIVSEVHRDVKQISIETEKKEEAAIYAVIIYKRLYDDISDRMKARNIRKYLNLGKEDKALTCIINCFDDDIYSIGYEDRLKISLIRLENEIDIKFCGEYLVKGATLSRGYVALYNYCEKLQYISLYYAEMQKKVDFSIERERIIGLYILGK